MSSEGRVARGLPWKSLAIILMAMGVPFMVPPLAMEQLLAYVPNTSSELWFVSGWAAGMMSAVGMMYSFKIPGVPEHFERFENWSETLEYPLRGVDR